LRAPQETFSGFVPSEHSKKNYNCFDVTSNPHLRYFLILK
jgi:hypothetical protein